MYNASLPGKPLLVRVGPVGDREREKKREKERETGQTER